MQPQTTPETTPETSQDEDMLLIRASCDAYASGVQPTDAFFDAVNRHDALLRRTAKYMNLSGSEEQLMPPRTLRVCASWLLNN